MAETTTGGVTESWTLCLEIVWIITWVSLPIWAGTFLFKVKTTDIKIDIGGQIEKKMGFQEKSVGNAHYLQVFFICNQHVKN